MAKSIRTNIISGLKWNAIGQFSRQIINFILMVILTRLLLPSEFGQIGILLVFIGIADVFINSGLNTALIQKNSTSNADYSTVFFFNLSVSLVFYLILFFSAPLIADFFEEPELSSLLRILALVFVINALGTIQATILTINLNFRKQNLISIIGVIISATISLYMAFNDYGVYSLIGQSLSFSITTNLILWLTSSWKPSLIFSKDSFRTLFNFGSKILASSILDRIFTTIDSLVVGKVFNTTQLGFYSRAKSTHNLPIMNTTGIISPVFFPVFSKIEDDDELRRYHLKFLSLIGYVIIPLMAGLIVVAKPLTLVLFTDKWLPSVPMLQIFAFYGALYPLSVILVQSLLVKGKAGAFLKLDVYKKIILLTSMLIGAYFGIFPFLFAICIANYLGFFLNLYVLSKTMQIKMIEYIKCFFPVVSISLIMAVFVALSGMINFPTVPIQLLVQITVGIFVYIALSKVFKLKDFYFLKELIFKRNK